MTKLIKEVEALAAEMAALLDRRRLEGVSEDVIFPAALLLAAAVAYGYRVPDDVTHRGLQAALNDFARNDAPPAPFDPGLN